MKLNFSDILKKNAFTVDFNLSDDKDSNNDIEYSCESIEVKWVLSLEIEHFGIAGFKYELETLKTKIFIENNDGNTTKLEEFNAEIKFYDNKAKDGYYCRIYEDRIVDNKWIEEEYAIFPINITIDESPIDHTQLRSQIFVKFVDLEIGINESKLELTI